MGRLVGLVREEEDSASEVGAERLLPFGGGEGGDESSTRSLVRGLTTRVELTRLGGGDMLLLLPVVSSISFFAWAMTSSSCIQGCSSASTVVRRFLGSRVNSCLMRSMASSETFFQNSGGKE